MKVRRLTVFAVAVGAALMVMLSLAFILDVTSDRRAESAAPSGTSAAHAAAQALFPERAQDGATSIITMTPAFTTYLPVACNNHSACRQLTLLEADYITACQYISPGAPAHGAINNVFGEPTWVVPSENAMAILGLKMASEILSDTSYLSRAQLAADYLIKVQDSDGAWFNQYSYTTPVDANKSPRQTAEVMIALYQLGYDSSRYDAMKKGAQYLTSCQFDDGLLGGGKDTHGQYRTWRWTHDNAYAYWGLRAAAAWANTNGDAALAAQYTLSAQKIIAGINAYLYEPSTGVWDVAVDANHVPQWEPGLEHLPSWIQYAPQMLDLPAYGVNSPRVGEWIHDHFQQGDGACIGYTWENSELKARKYPGLSFQAALCWYDTGHRAYADSAIEWAVGSGLWQTSPDTHGITGGWVDWIEVTPVPGQAAPEWQRFIDTSFYAIASCNGGYDFRIP